MRFETDGWLNLETYRNFLLLFWQVIFLFVALQIFLFAQYIQHAVYLMHKLIVFHQICYGCQIPLNAQIRVIAEIIKLANGYNSRMQCNNSILLAILVFITLSYLTGMNQLQFLWFSEWNAVSQWDACLKCEPVISSRQRSLFCLIICPINPFSTNLQLTEKPGS